MAVSGRTAPFILLSAGSIRTHTIMLRAATRFRSRKILLRQPIRSNEGDQDAHYLCFHHPSFEKSEEDF